MKLRILIALAFGALVMAAVPSAAQEGGMTLSDYFGKKKAEQEAAPTGKKQKQASAPAGKKQAAAPQKPAKGKKTEAPVVAAAKPENTGELRSESVRVGFWGRKGMLPETQALDGALQAREARKPFKAKAEFLPQTVAYSGYPRGTIVIDTGARYLYLVESGSKARRYAIAVGREGLEFKGTATVGDKQEWPRWFPTKAMQEREPRKYGQYKDGMNGGPDNPLGARAIYLYQGKKDTHVRIHGTNQPQSIGTNSSNGCFRMINEHVIDLYGRVRTGMQVVVL